MNLDHAGNSVSFQEERPKKVGKASVVIVVANSVARALFGSKPMF